ncbi:MAG: PAS domain S-box protein [Luteolibacter sp.]|jgi:PAS domain S-box-containing protein|nr:PAS domain S-box protein [Luteolibacter sp.]
MKKNPPPVRRVRKPHTAVLEKGRASQAPISPESELDVHQIELEIQNTELRLALDDAEVLLDKYTELYDFAPVGYFTLATDGTIRLANLTGSAMLGIGRANLIGRSFGMLVAHGQCAGFKAFLKQVFAAETKQSGEFDLADANLATRVVMIEARRAPNGLECSAMILDITARRQALERMRVSEIRYRRLFEAAHDGVLLIDPDTRKIIDANPFMTRLLGYPRDQLIGKELFEIGLLKDEATSRQMFRKLKRSHEVRYEDLPLESQAGRRQEVEVVANLYHEDGQPVIQCNIRDITVRKLAEDMSLRNVKLNLEIARRKVVEEDLRANRREQSRLLRQSRVQQKHLRDLSHAILHAQEEERKRISRELHDVIAQSLVGINVHLALLAQGNVASPETLRQQISKTQRLVEKAVEIVHVFARELRPTMLDDLGLIPALQAYLKQFMEDTGIRVGLKASAKIDQSATRVRTVLYRIAQEALTNVARHAKASRAEVRIECLEDVIHMTIQDDGQGFQVSGKAGSKKKNRLGLIGMKERAEMIGGTFQVDSAPGGPTVIQVEIPSVS